MKKFLFISLLLVGFSLASFSQVGNLFKPIENVLTVQKSYSGQKVLVNSKGLLDNVALRFNVGVTTTQSTYVNTPEQLFDTHPMSAVGFGLGLQWYTPRPDGSLFNKYGVNLLYLIQDGVDGLRGSGIGLFGNVDIFQLGVDYNFALKKVSLDTGITLKF